MRIRSARVAAGGLACTSDSEAEDVEDDEGEAMAEGASRAALRAWARFVSPQRESKKHPLTQSASTKEARGRAFLPLNLSIERPPRRPTRLLSPSSDSG